MAVELGRAYLQIMPSMDGFAKRLSKDMRREGLASGRKFSEGLGQSAGGSRLGKIGRKIGGALGTGLKRAAKFTGASIAAVLGLALAKGFGRLKSLDEAKAKLEGLGYEGQTLEKIMDDVSASVTGTAFGLDEAATAAAGALASGIKPGKELEDYLRLVADAATQAGTDFNSMAMMMTKVEGQGKLTGDVVNQMAENGLYVLPMLADAYGVSQEEMRKMVSAGEVDAKRFKEIMEENIGGSAERSGQTFSGAFKNMGAALGRIGANLLSGLFPKMVGGFGFITDALKKIEPAAKGVGEAIGNFLTKTVEKLTPHLKRFGAFFRDEIVPRLKDFAGYVKREIIPRLKDFGDFLRNYAETRIRDLADAFQNKILPALKDFGGFLRDTVWPIVQKVFGWLKDNPDVVKAFAGTILVAVAALKVWSVVQAALNVILAANPIGLVVLALAGLVAGLVYAYKHSETFRKVVDKAWAMIKKGVAAAWKVIKPILQGLWKNITKTLIPAFLKFWNNAVKPAMSNIAKGIRAMWVTASAVFNALRNFITGRLVPTVLTMRDKIRSAFNSVKSGISTAWAKIKKVLQAFRDMPGKIKDKFVSMKDGIKSTFDKVRAAAAKPIDFVIGKVYNEGIRKLIGKIPGVSEPGSMKTLKSRGYYNQGGILPGYTPGRDVHRFVSASGHEINLSGGEAILRPEATRAMGSGMVDAINSAARTRGARGVGRLLGNFARGGVVRSADGSSSTGRRVAPVNAAFGRWGSYPGHTGLDSPVPTGTPVKAFMNGIVSAVRHLTTSFGKHVRIRHAGGLETIYAHLSSISAKQGASINAGGLVGRSGSTGNSTGPHLHFEIRRNGAPINPHPYLSGSAKLPTGAVEAEGDEPGFKSIWKKVKEGIAGMAENGWAKMFKTAMKTSANSMIDWVNGKIPGSWLDLPKFAKGTASAPRGMAWVGERGPELVNFRGGERVYTAHDSARMAGAAAAQPTTFHLYDSDGVLLGTMRGEARKVVGATVRAAERGF